MKASKKAVQDEAAAIAKLEAELAQRRENLQKLEEATGPAVLRAVVTGVSHGRPMAAASRAYAAGVADPGYVQVTMQVRDGKNWSGTLVLTRNSFSQPVLDSAFAQKETRRAVLKVTIEEDEA